MSWVTPPVFTDGGVSDHQDMLDILTDLNWIKTQLDLCGGHAFWGYYEEYTIGDPYTKAQDWRICWAGRILHQFDLIYSNVRIQATDVGNDAMIRLLVDGNVIDTKTATHNPVEGGQWYSIDSPIDISGLSLPVYEWYTVQVETKAAPDDWSGYLLEVKAVSESEI